MKFTAGYTLLEAIVVLGIIAALASFGIYGLVTMRQSIQIQQSHSEFVSTLRHVQNLARNSVASQVLIAQTGNPLASLVDGYAIYFDSPTNYSIRYCKTSGTSMDCRSIEQANVKSASYADISVYPLGGSNCRGIFFERLTGNISGMSNALSNLDDIEVCTIRATHNSTRNYREITIDFAGNSIKIDK